VWFGPKERGLSTSLGVLSNIFGSLIGFSVPAIWIKDEDALNIKAGR